MLIIDDEAESVPYPVDVEIPGQGGVTVKQRITPHFRFIGADDLDVINDTAPYPSGDVSNAEAARMMAARYALIMTDLTGLADHNKQPIPFSQDNLELVIRSKYGRPIASALETGWLEFRQGGRAKNLK